MSRRRNEVFLGVEPIQSFYGGIKLSFGHCIWIFAKLQSFSGGGRKHLEPSGSSEVYRKIGVVEKPGIFPFTFKLRRRWPKYEVSTWENRRKCLFFPSVPEEVIRKKQKSRNGGQNYFFFCPVSTSVVTEASFISRLISPVSRFIYVIICLIRIDIDPGGKEKIRLSAIFLPSEFKLLFSHLFR